MLLWRMIWTSLAEFNRWQVAAIAFSQLLVVGEDGEDVEMIDGFG